MDYVDIINSFQTEYERLIYFGININENRRMSILSKIYSLVVQACIGIFNIMLFIDWVDNSTTIKGFASTGYIISSCIIGHLQLLTLYKNRKCVEELIKLFKQPSFRFQTHEEVEMGLREFRFFQKAKSVIQGITLVAIVAAIATPSIMGRHGELPFPAWYPVDISVAPVYYTAFFHQIVSAVILGFAYSHVNMLLCGMLTFIGLQCNVLCLRVENFGKIISEQDRHRVLSSCVVHHLEVIKFLKTTDKVFGRIYFWQLFASTMSLCMDLFLLSLADPKSFEYFYLIVYLISVTMILLVPCWFSSEMTRKSENIPIAAYNCNWVDASEGFKKELVFFMQRSQRPLKLYAANFFEISVEIFVKIIRASLSYFAILTNLNN